MGQRISKKQIANCFMKYDCCWCCCWSLTFSQPACHASGFAYVDNLKLDADMIRVLKPDPITFGAY